MMSGNLFQFDEYPQQQQQQQSIGIDPNAVGGRINDFVLHPKSITKLSFTVILDLRDYLACDLKLSDTALNDLFSEFDLNPNDFQYLDPGNNVPNYAQQTLQAPVDLPPSYDTALLSTTSNNLLQNPNMQSTGSVGDEYISLNTLKSLLEQHQAQQSLVKYAASPPESVPINYPEVCSKREEFFIRISSFLAFIDFTNRYAGISTKQNRFRS